MANEKHISLDLLKQFATSFKSKFDTLLNNKVDKVSGKGLSTEDYTTAEKSKLATLEPLTIKSIKVNNSVLTPDGSKAVNIDLSTYAIKTEVTQEIAEAVSGIEGFDAQVVEELPQTGKKGILYLVANSSREDKNAYDEYLWITDKYEKLGTRSIDLSQYALKSEVPTKVSQLTNDSDFQTAANVDTKLADYAKKTDIASVYKYKGSKANYAALPTSGNTIGDVWNVEAADSAHGIKAGDNVAWDGTKWDVLAGTIDTSNFATKDDLANIEVDFATTGDIDNMITEVFG